MCPDTSCPAAQLLTLSGVPGQLQLLRARRGGGGGAVCRGGGDVDEDLAAALVRDLDTGQAWTRGHSLYTLVLSRYLHFSTLTCVHLVEAQLGLGGSCGGQQRAGGENVLNQVSAEALLISSANPFYTYNNWKSMILHSSFSLIIIPKSVIFLGLPFIRAPGHGEVVRGDEGGGGGGAGQHLAHRGGAGGRARAAAHAVTRHLQYCYWCCRWRDHVNCL